MPKRNKPTFSHVPTGSGTRGVLEIEQFSEASLNRWEQVAQDFDELEATLYFGTEPERRRLRPQLIEAFQKTPYASVDLDRWVRIVSFRYGLQPLSSAGSLTGFGGRFNAGRDLDPGTLNAWPALYIAEDLETAFREKFQKPQNEITNGLSPQDLSLETGGSHSTVFVRGRLLKLFDLTTESTLLPVAAILRRVQLPPKAKYLRKKLNVRPGAIYMVQTAKQLHDIVIEQNWRTLPVQFGLPAKSHILAELIRAAGFEGILYKSTKGPSRCVALFPDSLGEESFIELADAYPPEVRHPRLDYQSAEELSGM